MRVSEFCEKYKISSQAVYKKMKKNEEKLDGHIKKDNGNVLDLDDFAVRLLQPKRETYRTLDEQNSSLLQMNKILTAQVDKQKEKITEITNFVTHLTYSNREYEVKHDKHVAEIALLTQERDKLKSELSKLQLSLSDRNDSIRSAEQEWADKISRLTAENAALTAQLQTANKQISDLTAQLEERNAKTNGFKGFFSK